MKLESQNEYASDSHDSRKKMRIGTRIIYAVFGALAVLFGFVIVLWGAYNVFVQRLPEFKAPANPLAALFPFVMIGVGFGMLRKGIRGVSPTKQPHGSVTPEQQIRNRTQWFRTSDEPLTRRMRFLLQERGFDPMHLVLAQCFPDDPDFEFGLVVTSDNRVYQFGFDYSNQTVEEGVFAEWTDLTDRYSDTPYRDWVSEAMKLVGKI